MKESLRRWWEVYCDGRAARKAKSAVSKELKKTESALSVSEATLEEERESRTGERVERIDRERMLKLQVRELEEQVAVNKITIENLTYETTRNRERLRAEVALAVNDRRSALEGGSDAQLPDYNA
jgi:hypothetical protein